MKCFVCGADNKKPLLSFHHIPTKKEIREKWANACGIEVCKISNKTRICSKHFKEEDFDESFWPKRRLLPHAVPSPSLFYKKIENTSRTLFLNIPIKSEEDELITNTLNVDEFMSPKSLKNEIPSCSINVDAIKVEKPDITPEARYVSDLILNHFSTPGKAKQNLNKIKKTVALQKNKIKRLQSKNRKLLQKFNDLKDAIRLFETDYPVIMEGISDEEADM